MNTAEISGISPAGLPPLPRLLLAYAPAGVRDWQALCWSLDQRLATVVGRGGEPTIIAIKLAWWDEVLAMGETQKGRGEPLVERWRALAPVAASAPAERLIDGWRVLASPDSLEDRELLAHALNRGGGLFGLLAGEKVIGRENAIERAGGLWALWDFAGHVGDESLAQRALALAGELPPVDVQQLDGAGLKPLRLALAVASSDIRAQRIPRGGFSLRHYARLLLASLRG